MFPRQGLIHGLSTVCICTNTCAVHVYINNAMRHTHVISNCVLLACIEQYSRGTQAVQTEQLLDQLNNQ